MGSKSSRMLSAQVALKPASGRSIDGHTVITSENIREYLPSPETVRAAQRAFVDAGFDVASPVGTSFSITAPASTFEKVFKVRLESDARGSARVASTDKTDYELPLSGLAESLRKIVIAVTFSPPPDFGPTSY
jgi:hypothetical protein